MQRWASQSRGNAYVIARPKSYNTQEDFSLNSLIGFFYIASYAYSIPPILISQDSALVLDFTQL